MDFYEKLNIDDFKNKYKYLSNYSILMDLIFNHKDFIKEFNVYSNTDAVSKEVIISLKQIKLSFNYINKYNYELKEIDYYLDNVTDIILFSITKNIIFDSNIFKKLDDDLYNLDYLMIEEKKEDKEKNINKLKNNIKFVEHEYLKEE